MNRFFFFSFCFLFLFSFAGAVSVESLQPNGFVNDFSGVLSAGEKAELEARVQGIHDRFTVEVAIAVVDSTDGKPVEQFAWELGNRWGVGKRDVFNGVLVLIAVEDRAFFVATAKGIEGALPDILVSRIAEKNFPPHFRNNDYAAGLNGFLSDLEAVLEGNSEIISQYASSDNVALDWENWPELFLALVLVSILSVPRLFMVLFSKLGGSHWIGLAVFELLFLGGVYWFVPSFFWPAVLIGFFLFLSGLSFSGTGFSGSRGWYSGGARSGGFSRGGSFGGGGGFSGGGAGGRW